MYISWWRFAYVNRYGEIIQRDAHGVLRKYKIDLLGAYARKWLDPNVRLHLLKCHETTSVSYMGRVSRVRSL